jgi:hypothetical protein
VMTICQRTRTDVNNTGSISKRKLMRYTKWLHLAGRDVGGGFRATITGITGNQVFQILSQKQN